MEEITFRQPEEITSFDLLLDEFSKVLLMADTGALKLLMATVIGNQLPIDPIWILLVAPSSGGKTELIASLNKLNDIIFPISDLTVNTFASGQKKVGKETSLLYRIPPGGILTFKDFTSMLSKNKEARTEIMSQMREIFDGEYVKRTGTGDEIIWKGKIGAIAGSTEAVYEHIEDLSAMGDRFVMYSMSVPDRIEVSKRVLTNSHDMKDKRTHLQDCTQYFIKHVLSNMKLTELNLSDEIRDELLRVADFATSVRSGVIMDERNRSLIRFVPSKEMPTRMTAQLYGVAMGFIAMSSAINTANMPGAKKLGELSDDEIQILYKIAFDSIPIKRRMALRALTRYKQGVTTKGLATLLNYQTPVVNGWLSQLNGLGICSREKKGNADMWNLKDKYRDIMVAFENIVVLDEELSSEDDIQNEDDWFEAVNDARMKEEQQEIDQSFEDIAQGYQSTLDDF